MSPSFSAPPPQHFNLLPLLSIQLGDVPLFSYLLFASPPPTPNGSPLRAGPCAPCSCPCGTWQHLAPHRASGDLEGWLSI